MDTVTKWCVIINVDDSTLKSKPFAVTIHKKYYEVFGNDHLHNHNNPLGKSKIISINGKKFLILLTDEEYLKFVVS